MGEGALGRRGFLRGAAGWAAAAAAGWAAREARSEGTVWQIDPWKCIHCGRCETDCVLFPSAVKCVHNFALCGYCTLCFGYFHPQAAEQNEAAENQVCPTGAILRRRVEGPYHEYSIDESKCTGCAKCVKGCTTFGNGSLQLQIRQDRCVQCNACSIARVCPSRAIRRVPVGEPYLLKGASSEGPR